jgi:uncharacterized protein YndB with AHSA1/START domain
MQIHQKIDIKASPQKVWSYLIPPSQMALWNEKVVSVKKISIGQESQGYRYEAIYRMNNKESHLSAEMVVFEPPYHLKICYQEQNVSDPKWFGRKIYEDYTLKVQGENTHLEQLITFENDGIPWFLRGLIYFIMTFGKPTGEPYLHKLKRLAEDN